MSDAFMEGFERGCLLGCAIFGVVCLIVLIVMGAAGYTLARHPNSPVLAPIDCKMVDRA